MSKSAEPKQSKSLLRVIAEAEKLGLGITPLRLDDGTRTAADAAAACNCTVGQIVKSVIFRVTGSDRHVLFLTAGDNRVDPAKASAAAGVTLEKADAAGVRKHTGFAIGGVSPLGHLTPIETFLDPDILQYETIWAAAGTPHHVFEIAPQALANALSPRLADFTLKS
ncbi:YbaK/EbsC family protein [Amaricoccus macauensis]|uniref:YbaK/EbsC family protein n=1 Tax=Amaricoccus macauensis TaxID=57001 RepID=UPI003C7D6F5D